MDLSSSNPNIPDQEQVEKARVLQDLLLEDLIRLFESGSENISAADRKLVYTICKDNGWSLDPSMVPQDLQDRLTSAISAADLDAEAPHLKAMP